jgi:hypothetical protein
MHDPHETPEARTRRVWSAVRAARVWAAVRRARTAGVLAASAALIAAPAMAANWSDKYGDPRSAISSPDYPNAGTPRGDAALAAAARSSGWSSTQQGHKVQPMARRSPGGVYGFPYSGRGAGYDAGGGWSGFNGD